jgi:alpha,alpha-trehalose phosphorylase
VLKLAGVMLALVLQGEQFTAEEKRADFEYYEPIISGDSSLSGMVQSIIAAEVGYHDLALRYFYRGLFGDLADLRTTPPRACTSPLPGQFGTPWCTGSPGCVTTAEPSPSTRACPDVGGPDLPDHDRGTRLRVTVRCDSLDLAVEVGSCGDGERPRQAGHRDPREPGHRAT